MGEKEQGAARESSAPSVSEREAASGMATGREAQSSGEPLDESPASVVKTKTKSNQSNDRLGQEGDPNGPESVQYNESELEFRKAGDAGGAADAGPVRLDPTPARVSQGGGNDIAIGDPGVNGN